MRKKQVKTHPTQFNVLLTAYYQPIVICVGSKVNARSFSFIMHNGQECRKLHCGPLPHVCIVDINFINATNVLIDEL